jgi:osmoprotectant transport system permease protein
MVRWSRPGQVMWGLAPVLLLAGMGLVVVIYSVRLPSRSLPVEFLTYERVLSALRRHLELVAVSSIGAILVSFPLGALLTRFRSDRAESVIVKILSVAQTVPSIAILGLSMGVLGLGFNTAVVALWLHALLPILHNTISGIRSVDRKIIEAAQGMGMRSNRVFLKIELPLSASVIMAGVRTAVVYNVGSAALATLVGAGGLGDLIVTGLSLNHMPVLITGSVLTALLAVVLDSLLGEVQFRLNPRGQPVAFPQ